MRGASQQQQHPSKKRPAEAEAEVEEEWDGGPGNYEIVEEAEGMKLLPSSTNITGYQGVKQHSKKYHAQHGKRFLGSYKTALKAAIAYARYLKEKRGGDGNEEVEDEEAATEEQGRRQRRTRRGSARRRQRRSRRPQRRLYGHLWWRTRLWRSAWRWM